MKRLFDILFASLALLLLSPVMLFVAWRVRRSLGAPVLFSQHRPGRAGKLFRLYKFRSMREAVDDRGEPLSDEARLTPFGVRLRSTSLDELPSLWNVLRGDMSLVGPRPLLPEYLPLYSSEQARRHDVRPGVTGWAQVNGRNTLSWDDKFALDLWYIDNRTLWLDVLVLWKTVEKVLRRADISHSDSVTMTPFTGNAPAPSGAPDLTAGTPRRSERPPVEPTISESLH